MDFSLRFAGLAVVLSLATSISRSEVLGTFEGEVERIFNKNNIPLPENITQGDRVIGCFLYRPEDARLEEGPDRTGIWQYRFRDMQVRSLFAVSISDRVRRSSETMMISVVNDLSLFGDNDPTLFDQFAFSYGVDRVQVTAKADAAVMSLSPEGSPGGPDFAWIDFIDRGTEPALLKSVKLPGAFEDFDFADADFGSGTVGTFGEPGIWAVTFKFDPASVVINGRPALTGAVPPVTADKAAGLCAEAVVSDASEAMQKR
jgi:hypothetical protein